MKVAATGMSIEKFWYVIVAIAVLALDQLSKYWVSATLKFGADLMVIKGFINLSYTENSGIAFGMLNDSNVKWVLVLISVLAMVMVIFYLMRAPMANRLLLTSLSLLAGGISGNLIDRIRIGRVIDFIEVYYKAFHWPIFNLADAAISIGAVLLALDLLFAPQGGREESQAMEVQPDVKATHTLERGD
jgi:signal peptidase II